MIRRLDKNPLGLHIQIALDLFDALCPSLPQQSIPQTHDTRTTTNGITDHQLDIENAHPPAVHNIPHGADARPVKVPGELGRFNEMLLCSEGFELGAVREVVVLPIGFSGTGWAGSICLPSAF